MNGLLRAIVKISQSMPEKNINQIARAINQSHLISQDQLQELSKGVGELIKEVDKEFQVEVKRLKEFHGSY